MRNIRYMQENIAIMGLQGTGKTYMARRILDTIPSTPRTIVSPQDPMRLYGEYGYPITKVDEIQPKKAHVWTGEPSRDNLELISKRLMDIGNTVLVIDDVHEFCSKQKIEPEFNRLIQSGRNQNISSIFISTAPNLVHNAILQSCKHFFIFQMQLDTQIEWLTKNALSSYATKLLPSWRREGKTETTYESLPAHHFIYANAFGDKPIVYSDKMEVVE